MSSNNVNETSESLLVPANSCYGTTDPIECSSYAYDFSCLTKDYPPGSTLEEIVDCSYCCVLFWLKKLHPHRYSSQALAKEYLMINSAERWRNLFLIVDQLKSQSSVQIKFQHIAEPTIRYIDSLDQMLPILSNTGRSTTFVTTNLSGLIATAQNEKHLLAMINSPKVIHLYSYESIPSLYANSGDNDDGSDNTNNGSDNGNGNGNSNDNGSSNNGSGNNNANNNGNNGSNYDHSDSGKENGNSDQTNNGSDNAESGSGNAENGGDNGVRSSSRQLLLSSFASKITFIPDASVDAAADTSRAISSQNKENLLMCLTSTISPSTAAQTKIKHLLALCVERGFPTELCALCNWVNIDTSNKNSSSKQDEALDEKKKPKKLKKDFNKLKASKFVLSILNDLSQISFVQNSLLFGNAIPITSKKIMQSECLNVHSHMDCLSWTVNQFTGRKLPIVFAEEMNDHSVSKIKSLRMLLSSKSVMTDWLIGQYDRMTNMNTKDGYSVSALFFSYYLSLVMPHSQMLQHISRQGSKYSQFMSEFIPNIKYTINQSPMMVTSYFYRYQYKLKSVCMIDHVPFKAVNDHSIISPESVEKTTLLSSRRARKNQMSSFERRPVLDIVLPRCCESMEGDLSWLKAILQDYKLSDEFFRVSVYYKCPWCIPFSKVNEWKKEYRDYKRFIEQQVARNNTNSQENNFDNANMMSSAYEMLLSKGGILLLDEIQTFRDPAYSIIREYPAFDWFVNGKEITAYLKHILQHYDNQQLGNFTMFLHTQPSHHLEFRRFSEIIKYLKICHHSIQAMVEYQQQVPLDSKIEYLHLNYRWMEGAWAHQPER